MASLHFSFVVNQRPHHLVSNSLVMLSNDDYITKPLIHYSLLLLKPSFALVAMTKMRIYGTMVQVGYIPRFSLYASNTTSGLWPSVV